VHKDGTTEQNQAYRLQILGHNMVNRELPVIKPAMRKDLLTKGTV
jgi:hypothetical protein